MCYVHIANIKPLKAWEDQITWVLYTVGYYGVLFVVFIPIVIGVIFYMNPITFHSRIKVGICFLFLLFFSLLLVFPFLVIPTALNPTCPLTIFKL